MLIVAGTSNPRVGLTTEALLRLVGVLIQADSISPGSISSKILFEYRILWRLLLNTDERRPYISPWHLIFLHSDLFEVQFRESRATYT